MDIKVEVKNKGINIPDEIIEITKDKLIGKIFYNRGYDDPKIIEQMLDDTKYIPTSASEFPGMEGAVDRLIKAFDDNEKICIYGDYDVDGVTSTVVLYECFSNYTSNIIYHVPDRFKEGYGMNKGVIEKLGEEKVDLIITCDCGVTNIEEIELAKNLNIDVIITDHHKIGDNLPPAEFILNPKLLKDGHKARNISGCAMAYFVCKAIYEKKEEANKEDELLDMVGLSLIADVVSLNGENRYLLKKALKELASTKREGLLELFDIIEKDPSNVNEEDVGFQIAPRINAAGRMDSARLPVDLFLSKEKEEVEKIAYQVDFLNKERKRIQEEMIKDALEIVEKRKKHKTIIVVYNDYWHHGIIGIGAGKICETYRKPTIMLSLKDDGETIVGSARSVEEVNIYDLIKEVSEHLIKFGGHSQAAGLSLKKSNLKEFISAIEEIANNKYYFKDEILVHVDEELDVSNINEEVLDRIKMAGPFGEGFEMPTFLTRKLSVVSDRRLKNDHHIMVLADENDQRIPGVKWFGLPRKLEGEVFDVTYRIDKNTYKGSNEIRLSIDQMIESVGANKKLFNGEFIDERECNFEDLLKKYGGEAFFFEGLRKNELDINIVNRFNAKKTNTLVLLSTPQSLNLFKEIVALTNPKKLVINFSYNNDYDMKKYIMNFMGIVKYIIVKESGKTDLGVISSKLSIEEPIILTTLKLLKAYCKFDYILYPDNYNILIYNIEGMKKTNTFTLEKQLKNSLLEKEAYRNYLKKLKIQEFYNCLV